MTLLTDSSFIYALYNMNDPSHLDARRFVAQNREQWLVPNVVLPEVCYLITRDMGHRHIRMFLEYFAQLDASFEPIVWGDLERIQDIVSAYADAEFDIVDCCVMAMSERLNLRRIATFDRRDFSMFRPRHCDFLELLP